MGIFFNCIVQVDIYSKAGTQLYFQVIDNIVTKKTVFKTKSQNFAKYSDVSLINELFLLVVNL